MSRLFVNKEHQLKNDTNKDSRWYTKNDTNNDTTQLAYTYLVLLLMLYQLAFNINAVSF